MSLYNLRTTAEGWRCTKFDSDLNVESSYNLRAEHNKVLCECPQSSRGHCRHINIFSMFFNFDRVDTGWFYDYDHLTWHPPIETGEAPPLPVPAEVEKVASAPHLTPSAGITFEGDFSKIRRF